MQIHCESDLFQISIFGKLPGSVIRCHFNRYKYHCERGKLFVSLLGSVAYAAVSRDFLSVLYLRFCQSVNVDRDFK